MPQFDFPIPPATVLYARATFEDYVSSERFSGFEDEEGKRGFPDFHTVVGMLGFLHFVAMQDRSFTLYLCVGQGDGGSDGHFDHAATHKRRSVNIKVSSHKPSGDLNLIVKEGEKPADIYVQCLVQAGEPDLTNPLNVNCFYERGGYSTDPLRAVHPMLYILGWCEKDGAAWKAGARQPIMRKGEETGKFGWYIPQDKLHPIGTLLQVMPLRI